MWFLSGDVSFVRLLFAPLSESELLHPTGCRSCPDLYTGVAEPLQLSGAAPTPPPTPPTVWQQVYSAEHKAYYYWNQDRRSEVAMALTSSTGQANTEVTKQCEGMRF